MKNVFVRRGGLGCVPCILLLGSLAGCSSQAVVQPKPPPTTVKVMSLEEVEQRVAALQGKVVVLDLWATW